MRIILSLFFAFFVLKADFLGNFYMDLRELKFSKEQQTKLNNIMRRHHAFLRQWYIDFKKTNDDIMESFSNSSLKADSTIINNSIQLENQRVLAEQRFLLNVYEILSKEQRAILGAKIREIENYSRILQDKFEDSQKFHQAEVGDKPFEYGKPEYGKPFEKAGK